jgi:tetratricopeptide (TPR) repeat protein
MDEGGFGAVSQLLAVARRAESLQHWTDAAVAYLEASRHCSADHRLLANAATALWYADRASQALPLMQRAAALAPADWQPQRGLGNLLRDLNRWEEASRAYSQALVLANDPLTAWNHSQVLIGLERYPEAFAAADRRLQLPELEPYRQPSVQPFDPNHAAGHTVHIWSEQGFGDTFQFLRWLVPLCQGSHAVVLEVEPQLVELLHQGLAWLPLPPRVEAKQLQAAPPLPVGAQQASLLSLPHLLRNAPWPCRPGPYLRLRMPRPRDVGPRRVGLVWAAGRKLSDPFTAREYRRRSLPRPALEHLCSTLIASGVTLVSLQHGEDAALAEGLPFQQTLPANSDFAAAARCMLNLDLLISVDTATAHLCGALGLPGWILLPWSADPRWLRRRHDCPWYPSLQLFRQPSPGDWMGLIADLVPRINHGSLA